MEMSAEDLASDARKANNQKIREHALWDAQRGASKKATTDQFQCGKCRQRKCTYYVRSPPPRLTLHPQTPALSSPFIRSAFIIPDNSVL